MKKIWRIWGIWIACAIMLWSFGGTSAQETGGSDLPLLDDLSFLEDFPDETESTDNNSFEDMLPLATKVSLSLTGIGSRLNNDSRLNPDNRLQNIEEGEAMFEAQLSVSDYIDQQGTMRWLLKSYSYYSSTANDSDKRLNRTRIDEAFLDWNSGDLFFSLGKRRINWGHAMAFNPVNVIVPPRDPLNPNQETEGQPVVWTGYSRSFGALNLFYTRDFDKDWNSDLNRWGANISVYTNAFDLSLYYFDGEEYQDGRKYERLTGASFSTNLTAGVTLYAEAAGFWRNYRNYYDSNGNSKLDDTAVVQAAAGSFMLIDPESFLSFFNGDASLMLEAYYNGGGYTPDERANYFEALDTALAQGNPGLLADYRFTGMNQFYGLFSYRNGFKERYSTELTGLIAQDWSFSLQGQLTYTLSDYYSLSAKVTRNQGDDDTEFGNAPTSDLFEVMLDINF